MDGNNVLKKVFFILTIRKKEQRVILCVILCTFVLPLLFFYIFTKGQEKKLYYLENKFY